MSNITSAIKVMIMTNTQMTEESKAAAVEHLDRIQEMADKYYSRELTMRLNVDTSLVDQMLINLESMKNDLSGQLVSYAKANGFVVPPPGSEWIPVDRVGELEPGEGVIVSDGKSWGLAKYNEHRVKVGNPFPVVYEVAESMRIMDDVTHFRRLTAVALPDGSLMKEPQPVILKKDTMRCPDCKHSLLWEQIHGLRLYQTVKVDGKEVEAYKARCSSCHVDHWVKR